MANIVFGFQGGDEKKEEPKKKGWFSLFGSLNKVVEQERAREIPENWEIEDKPSFLDEDGQILEDEITYPCS